MGSRTEHGAAPSPKDMETDQVECEVQGSIPKGLEGAFFRLGGAWYYPPKFPDDIPLHADGFMSAFRISGGRVGYSGRFVETARLRANREAGRMRFGYYRNRVTDDPDVASVSASAANTSAFAFGGKLLALKEDGLPYEIDPVTLATKGAYDFDGRFRSQTFTAHPKIDGRTGELVTFGYQATGPLSDDAFLYVFGPNGDLRNEIRIKLPRLEMIHDMAITRDHIVLPMVGYGIDREGLKAGGALWKWDPTPPARIAVLRRDGDGGDLRWFTGPKTCQLHIYNAYEEAGRIVLDAPFYVGNPFPFLASLDGGAWRPKGGQAFLRRLTLDLESDGAEWREEILFDVVIGDLGDVDPRYVGRRHRYCFGMHESPPTADEKPVEFVRPPWPIANCYVRFDLERLSLSMLKLPRHQALGECVFVPKSPEAREGEGYLVGVADDLAAGVSELLVADAEHLEQGPIARARLPMRAGPQVHACWVAEGEAPLRALP